MVLIIKKVPYIKPCGICLEKKNKLSNVTCSCCPYLYFGSAIMLVTYFVNFRQLNDHLFGKELFIRFTASAFRKLPSVYVFSYFPFGFEGRMWDLIDHCLSFYFAYALILIRFSPRHCQMPFLTDRDFAKVKLLKPNETGPN